MRWIVRIFGWWRDATPGTFFTIRRRAREAGRDSIGNRYFEERKRGSNAEARRRRWVIYHGVAEPSRIDPEWHAWLHFLLDTPPSVSPLPRQTFERDAMPNMTGTRWAYRPEGSLGRRDEAQPERGYDAWHPDAP